VIINVFAIVVVALVFSYFVDYLYLEHISLKFAEALKGHDHAHAAWWEVACAIILVILTLKGIFVEEIQPRLAHKPHSHDHGESCH
jgi:Na+/H+ antiporter NhaD/arsenite permease-like protein